MGHLSSGRVRIRRERLVSGVIGVRPAALALALLAGFIAYGSAGPWRNGTPSALELPGISLPDIAQNILLYVPFGVLVAWMVREFNLVQTVVICALGALAYGAAMELLQVLQAGRIASAVDVAANVAGASLGAGVAGRVEHGLAFAIDVARRGGFFDTRARYVVALLLAVIFAVLWYPFDVTLDISTLSERTRAVRHDPWLWPTRTSELWWNAAITVVVTVFLSLCLGRLSRGAAAGLAFVLTIGIAAILDLGQLAMGSQSVGGAVFVSQALGAAAGAAVGLVATVVRGTRYAAA